MADFPFEKVHHHFAKQLDGIKIEGDMLTPAIILAIVKSDGAITCKPLPDWMSKIFFCGPGGTAELGQLMREFLAEKNSDETCLVVIAESYKRQMDKDEFKNRKIGSLADDPKAEEVVIVTVHHISECKAGYLTISADRVMHYDQSDKIFTISGGKLSNTPAGDELPNGVTLQ